MPTKETHTQGQSIFKENFWKREFDFGERNPRRVEFIFLQKIFQENASKTSSKVIFKGKYVSQSHIFRVCYEWVGTNYQLSL